MKRTIRFLDLSVNTTDRQKYVQILDNILMTGQLILGDPVQELEAKLADYVGVKHCLAVSSGSDALLLSLKCCQFKEGSEIIVPALSWIATANAVIAANLTPVFCDIDETLNISTNAITSLISDKTKAILAVDYTGKMCNYDELIKISNAFGLKLIVDGSQSFGASRNGKNCGSLGDVAAISHNPMKVFAALGEAGSIFTNDSNLFEILKILRYAGTINKETCIYPSLNHRMDTFHAAVLLDRLKYLDTNIISKRIANAQLYTKELSAFVCTPNIHPNERHVFYTYTIICEKRDLLQEYLTSCGIETKIQHKCLMPDQPCYSSSLSNTLSHCTSPKC